MKAAENLYRMYSLEIVITKDSLCFLSKKYYETDERLFIIAIDLVLNHRYYYFS